MINDSSRVMWCSRRAHALAARTAAAGVAIASLALLAGACTASPSAAGSGGARNTAASENSPSAVAYSQCVRSHGVPNFPDPPSSGAVPKGSAQEFGVSSSEYQAATQACQHLYPTTDGSIQLCETTGDCPQAVVQQGLSVMRRYAQCMRAHGVPNWPDPTVDSEGRPYFDVSGAGITYQDTHSALFESKDSECERLIGGSAGVPVPLG